jgi:hypothetical protein
MLLTLTGRQGILAKRNDRYKWYQNLSGNVVAEAVKFGGQAADALAVKALADTLIANHGATNTAQRALDGIRLVENNTEAAHQALIRAYVRNWKTLPAYPASGSEAVLHLKGVVVPFNPLTYQTVIKVSLVPGGVRVSFIKNGADGVDFYMRVVGTANWRKVGMATESPFTDITPLAVAGVPEQREYMARGFQHDVEIGVDSATVSIIFAG